MITYNRDVDSSKYENLRDVFRPGHADYTYWAKYGHRDHRGGGRSSARETWGRVAAGAIARKILASVGVEIYGFTREIGGIEMQTFDRDEIERNLVRCPDPVAAEAMTDAILAVKESARQPRRRRRSAGDRTSRPGWANRPSTGSMR